MVLLGPRENIKWHIFLDVCCCCNANRYSRMVDKFSTGSNSRTFKTVSIDIGVIGVQGKATETRKTVILTKKKKRKKKKMLSNHIWKKKFYVTSTEMYDICLPPKIDTLSTSEQRACHNMSNIHTAWGLFCQILTDQCTTVLTNQKAKTQKTD